MTFIVKIRMAFGLSDKDFPMSLFFADPCVAGLALALSTGGAAEDTTGWPGNMHLLHSPQADGAPTLYMMHNLVGSIGSFVSLGRPATGYRIVGIEQSKVATVCFGFGFAVAVLVVGVGRGKDRESI